MIEQAIATVSKEIADQMKAARLPPNLRRRIEEELAQRPELSWDVAVAHILRVQSPIA